MTIDHHALLSLVISLLNARNLLDKNNAAGETIIQQLQVTVG